MVIVNGINCSEVKNLGTYVDIWLLQLAHTSKIIYLLFIYLGTQLNVKYFLNVLINVIMHLNFLVILTEILS